MNEIAIPAKDRGPALERACRLIEAAYPGKSLVLTVEVEVKERSDRQNKALFGHAYKVIAANVGLSGRKELEKLHTDFCCRFYGERIVEALGAKYRLPVRTTTTDEAGKRDVINVGEFSAFYGDVERIAAECGIFIPAPDPRWFLDA